MQRIDTPTAVPDKFGPGKSGWRDGNKAQGIPATAFNAAWCDNVQEEICNVIEAAKITLDENDKTQLLQAIRGIISARQATEKVAGIARIATAEEAAAGEDDGLIITPAKLANALKNIPQGNYQNVFSLPTSTQLDATHFGSLIYAGMDEVGVVITLPKSDAAAKGKKITLTANRAGVTINSHEGDHIRFGNFTHTQNGFFLPGFSLVSLASNGNGNWTAVSEVCGGSLGRSGYRVYPDGMILQWGSDARNAAGGITWTNYHIPFNTIPFISVSPFNSGEGARVSACLTHFTTTNFRWSAFYDNALAQLASQIGCFWIAIGY